MKIENTEQAIAFIMKSEGVPDHAKTSLIQVIKKSGGLNKAESGIHDLGELCSAIKRQGELIELYKWKLET